MPTSRPTAAAPPPVGAANYAPALIASSAGAPALPRSTASWNGCTPTNPNCSGLDRPGIPLNTNGSERDIRAHVITRKISGGTRSGAGRQCRDAFFGLAKTCAKLGLTFWDYLGDRLAIPGQVAVPYPPELICCRGQPPNPPATGFAPLTKSLVRGLRGSQSPFTKLIAA